MDTPANCSSFFSGDAMEKILKDQEEFEKEHQFMQVDISPNIDTVPKNLRLQVYVKARPLVVYREHYCSRRRRKSSRPPATAPSSATLPGRSRRAAKF